MSMPPRPQYEFASSGEIAAARSFFDAALPEDRKGPDFTEAVYQLCRDVLGQLLSSYVRRPWSSPNIVACYEICAEHGYLDVFDGVWIATEAHRRSDGADHDHA